VGLISLGVILRILWLKTELLHPIDKGGKIRTYNMLRELKRDHHITYLCLDDGFDPDARLLANEYCHDLICVPHEQSAKFSAGFYVDLAANFLSRFPYAIKKYESDGMRRHIVELTALGNIDVVVCDFLAPAINVPTHLHCPTVLFQHNVEAMIWKRHFEVQQNSLKKSFLRGQWQKMKRTEAQLCRQFDSVITVSPEDRDVIKSEYGILNVTDVPTGVDTEFFKPSGKEPIDVHNVVFTGSMDWLPNEDAIRFFVEDILPKVRRRVPQLTLTVVGRNPYPALLELSKKDPSIIVTGRVDDVRPYMERAAAYVVPLRVGGGTRIKIFEAMAMEKAIVSTSIGAEGLPVEDGRDINLADTPESFAAVVTDLLLNPELARSIGQHAADTVRTRFGWSRVAMRFAEICEDTINVCGNRHLRSIGLGQTEQPAV